MTSLLSYEVCGSGPGLVLLHGTSSTGLGSWGAVLDGLAAHHTVVLPDLPGSGSSPLPTGPLSMDTIADQIVATAQAAGVEQFAVAGASLGAAIAVKVAGRHPEATRKLATVVGYAHPRPTLRMNLELWASMHEREDEAVGKLLTTLSFSERYLAGLPAKALEQVVQSFGAQPAPGTAEQIALTLAVDVRDDLADVAVPALIVAATEDRFVAPEHSYELAEKLPRPRLVEVKGGHASMFEDPEQTLRPLLNFLDPA